MNPPVAVHDPDGHVLLHVWMVDPQRADRHIQLLTELVERIAGQPAFVAARILTSAGRSSIAAMVAMRTEEDREQLERHPAVQDVLHQLSGSPARTPSASVARSSSPAARASASWST